MSLIVAMLLLVTLVLAQRSPYAGSRPSGYHDRLKPTPAAVSNDIGNRFGSELNPAASSGNVVTTVPQSTQRVPIDYQHDREYYEILSQYPVDRQPFWLVNYQTIEAHREPIRG